MSADPNQYGGISQGEQGLVYVSTVDDVQTQADSEGHYASEGALLDATGRNPYGMSEVPADVLIEYAQHFYTALRRGAFDKAAAGYARTNTYFLSPAFGQPNTPVQILRANPGRRFAQLSYVCDKDAITPWFYSPNQADLQTLVANVVSQMGGVYAAASAGSLAGPWIMRQPGPLGSNAVVEWQARDDLFAVAPFAITGANSVYVTVTEYYDS